MKPLVLSQCGSEVFGIGIDGETVPIELEAGAEGIDGEVMFSIECLEAG